MGMTGNTSETNNVSLLYGKTNIGVRFPASPPTSPVRVMQVFSYIRLRHLLDSDERTEFPRSQMPGSFNGKTTSSLRKDKRTRCHAGSIPAPGSQNTFTPSLTKNKLQWKRTTSTRKTSVKSWRNWQKRH